VYSRETHEPVPDAFTAGLETPLVIVEGNYLLLWPEVRDALDLRIYLDCDPALARRDLIARHRQGGASEEEAVRKFEQNDRLNRETVEATRGAAQLRVWRDVAGWTLVRHSPE
jgi:pantothenate kinase